MLKEFEPTFSRGGDMAMDFLSPAARVKELRNSGESGHEGLARERCRMGYEVGYRYFTSTVECWSR